jgi:hypothetical protein
MPKFDSIYQKQEQAQVEQQEALVTDIIRACGGDRREADMMLKNALMHADGDISLARNHLNRRRNRRRKEPQIESEPEVGEICGVSVIGGAHAEKDGKLKPEKNPIVSLAEGKFYTVLIGKRGKEVFVLGKHLARRTGQRSKPSRSRKGAIQAVRVTAGQHAGTDGRLRRTVQDFVAGRYYYVYYKSGLEVYVLGEHLKQSREGEAELTRDKVLMSKKIQGLVRGRTARNWVKGEREKRHRIMAKVGAVVRIQRLYRRKFVKFRMSEVPSYMLAETTMWDRLQVTTPILRNPSLPALSS